MKGYMTAATGAAVGYVMGTRAGRERYEELRGQATAALRAGRQKGEQLWEERRARQEELSIVLPEDQPTLVPASSLPPSLVDPDLR